MPLANEQEEEEEDEELGAWLKELVHLPLCTSLSFIANQY
jgi:hypothetical protein